jgi:hypothetical protein
MRTLLLALTLGGAAACVPDYATVGYGVDYPVGYYGSYAPYGYGPSYYRYRGYHAYPAYRHAYHRGYRTYAPPPVRVGPAPRVFVAPPHRHF